MWTIGETVTTQAVGTIELRFAIVIAIAVIITLVLLAIATALPPRLSGRSTRTDKPHSPEQVYRSFITAQEARLERYKRYDEESWRQALNG
jgi:hypothetical protein